MLSPYLDYTTQDSVFERIQRFQRYQTVFLTTKTQWQIQQSRNILPKNDFISVYIRHSPYIQQNPTQQGHRR